MHSFWCFYISHAIRMMRELRPFLISFGKFLLLGTTNLKNYWCWPEAPLGWIPTSEEPRSKHGGHKHMTQGGVGWILQLDHNGQTAGWGRPRLARRSAVQHRFFTASQMKILHRRGAQVFQILFQGTERTLLKRRHYMQIFYCVAIFCELPADDPLLLVARSNHWPAPCLARCFWHNLYDCLLSITFSYCHLLLSQKPFWLNHNLLVSSGALLLIGACSSNNAQGTYICFLPFIDHICVLVVKLCIDSIL